MTADERFLHWAKNYPRSWRSRPAPPSTAYGCLQHLRGTVRAGRTSRPSSIIWGGVGKGTNAAARLVGVNPLVSLQHAAGSLDHVMQVLQIPLAANSVRGFTGQSLVINGCSDTSWSKFFHVVSMLARMAFGSAELPST